MSEKEEYQTQQRHEYRKVDDIIPENYGAFVMTTKQNKEELDDRPGTWKAENYWRQQNPKLIL